MLSIIYQKTIPKILNTLLPANENVAESHEEISDNFLEGQGIEKTIVPSNITDLYTNLEVLLGLKLSDHTDTLTEASKLTD